MPLDITADWSTLVQIIAWCRQASSHYLGQCWLRSLLLYGVTRPQWANKTVPWRGAIRLSYGNKWRNIYFCRGNEYAHIAVTAKQTQLFRIFCVKHVLQYWDSHHEVRHDFLCTLHTTLPTCHWIVICHNVLSNTMPNHSQNTLDHVGDIDISIGQSM